MQVACTRVQRVGRDRLHVVACHTWRLLYRCQRGTVGTRIAYKLGTRAVVVVVVQGQEVSISVVGLHRVARTRARVGKRVVAQVDELRELVAYIHTTTRSG